MPNRTRRGNRSQRRHMSQQRLLSNDIWELIETNTDEDFNNMSNQIKNYILDGNVYDYANDDPYIFHTIVQYQLYAIANALIDVNADTIHQIDYLGNNACSMAAINNIPDLIPLLKSKNVNWGQINNDGDTVLSLILQNCNLNNSTINLCKRIVSSHNGYSKYNNNYYIYAERLLYENEILNENNYENLEENELYNNAKELLELMRNDNSQPTFDELTFIRKIHFVCTNENSDEEKDKLMEIIRQNQYNSFEMDNDGNTSLMVFLKGQKTEQLLGMVKAFINTGTFDYNTINDFKLACNLKLFECAYLIFKRDDNTESISEKIEYINQKYNVNIQHDEMEEFLMSRIGREDTPPPQRQRPRVRENTRPPPPPQRQHISDLEKQLSLVKYNMNVPDVNNKVNINKDGYDVINLVSVKVSDFIAEDKDNLAIYAGDAIYLTSKSDIVHQMNEPSNIKIPCENENILSYENFLMSHEMLQISIGAKILIPLNVINGMLNTDKQLFILHKTNAIVNYIVSQSLLQGVGQSSDVCKSGYTQNIFTVIEAEPESIQNESAQQQLPRTPSPIQTPNVFVQYNEKKYKYDISPSQTTISDIIEQFKTSIHATETATVQLVLMGKIYKNTVPQDMSIIVSEINNFTSGIVFNAIVRDTPVQRGGVTRKNTRINIMVSRTRKSKKNSRMTRKISRKPVLSCGSKDKIVRAFMELQNMIKIYHWNTHSYAEHKATDELHERLGENIDKFVETMLGKDSSRIEHLSRNISLQSLKSKTSLREKMFVYRRFLMGMNKCFDSSADSDLLNIRDEILGDINQFLYLLTLK